MTNIPSDLLPEGFRDRLPPHAASAAKLTRAMLDVLASHGYGRVEPSMAEFEETMAARSGGMMRNRLLRFSDPVSGHTLALRGDITVQVGRIATTRLADAARPLRLSYRGHVLRLKAAPLRPEREITQLGAELIGNDSVAAASEIVAVAIEALEAAGVKDIIADFTLPDLVELLAKDALPLPSEKIDAVRTELDMKDAGGLAALGAQAYLPLLEATGPFAEAAAKLEAIDSDGLLSSRIAGLREIAERLEGRATITLDPTERHGFEYQSWFGFTLFARGHAAALGRGGTYTITRDDGSEEAATGFSLYPDPLMDGILDADEDKRLFLPLGTDPAKAARLRGEGWITIAALDGHDDARRLGCGHILHNGRAVPTE
ncbi:ATP phosphoribosyltransferase regulatory subunit [Sphingorhabdus arenilitoris]|uniref:ATP phosphoribosyltransferase regulatory subunit n=1 Tax=Sphingorhabdus arenilitoris TaxID=1490041 RepID=A0ABV8RDX3_9SPHN